MGILAPIFLAGLAGLTIPLLLHLVRRTPRGRQQFSSLMFLSPTPPRLTRRSRLDQVLLLLLRLGALALLAFAFARPFLRESSLLSINDLPRRRVALVIDTSASMRRGDLWKQAIAAAKSELDELAPHDEVALYSFNDRVQTVVSFATEAKPVSAAPAEIVRQALGQLEPTWAASDLGSAIAALAAELEAASDLAQSAALPQLVVISDFQRGSRVEALQGFDWPQDVRAIPRQVKLKQTSNATLQLLATDAEAGDHEPRVRVANASDSTQDQFFVRWLGQQDPNSTAGEVSVYVPPGQSRIVKLPRSENNLRADRIVLRGDAHEFDNTYYVVPPRQQQITLTYVGDDKPDDPQGSQYYLRLAVADDPLRQVTFNALSAEAALPGEPQPQVMVVTSAQSAMQQAAMKAFVEQGAALILVPQDQAAAASLPGLIAGLQLLSAPEKRSETDFQLLGEIAFAHPLFFPFANPRYNDFTRIHFWQHRPVLLAAESNSLVLARFDNGDPWLIESPLGKGRIWTFTSSWHPEDSQLAVSTKFLPLVSSLLDQACGTSRLLAGSIVNAPVPLPRDRSGSLKVQLPSGKELVVEPTAAEFRETAEPGIYRAGSDGEKFRFAVNLPPSESDTAPLALEQLEQQGLKLGQAVSKAERLSCERQERDTELESRQQVWRWLIVGCLGVLVLETWWAARASRVARATEAVA